MKTKFILRPPTQGFSLVELMVTISVAAILLAIGAPSFSSFINNQKLVSTASEFYAAINMTRSEAIKRGSRVDMVPNDGANWSSGWTVFIDANSNQIVDPGETIIFFHEASANIITIASTFVAPYISYTGNGRTRTNASSQTPNPGTVSFTSGSTVRIVIINFLGRSQICDPSKSVCTAS
ncbi:GspH/FimT family pseudopilin [Undibacterium sp. RTI2.1]|uniref:GspH/FimT family pseudopilin n=1 Tax=unclassified Undibacterium TaxID=2630295 RepID=UPI002AB53CB1|nr:MULTISPECIES: GspH/FimT family pseudopilin [unclassified Undibacterium]MDY7537341.1 GspH/FimT family pseudopilin [Undibacterium sp. 5I1]MEB0033103.1 GspH/FimT family pseudopilin [Undibacterium sp. RTI2.1]MEB0118916.1 GspH/FimT family pseudopilin [Undibacterium sp. RTI2.2]MEB0233082.1 GspH/FimT family pseudopilin [Undibacterium sp. 10I3]MEB0259835.1 GspH/FimT family pseudopilin [Undibacterium sp. 5I1]